MTTAAVPLASAVEVLRQSTRGKVAVDGQGTGTCPVCKRKDKFTFRSGDNGYLVVDCKTCTDPDPHAEDRLPWLAAVRAATPDVPDSAWGPVGQAGRSGPRKVPQPPTARELGPSPRCPSEREIAWWSDALTRPDGEFVARSLVKRMGLDHDGLARAQVGYNPDEACPVMLPVRDPETGLLLTVLRRSFAQGADPKSMIWPGSSGAYVYAPFGIEDDAPVILVGGEKDALALGARGYNAVSFTNGEGAVPPEPRLRCLSDRDVVIVYDVDEKGRAGARRVASGLAAVARSIRITDLGCLPGLPENGDPYDALELHGVDGIDRVLSAAEPWEAGPGLGAEFEPAVRKEVLRLKIRDAAQRQFDADKASATTVTLPRQTLDAVLAAPRPVEAPERISELHRVGYNSTITAQYKTGKTTLGGNLLRSLADGAPFLGRFPILKPHGRIGLLNYELSEADMLDWLDDQGISHTERIAVLNLRGVPFSLASERNCEELVAWCRDMDVEVLNLDPHRRAFAGFGEENNNDDVNRFTGVLDEIKREAGVSDLFLYVHTGRGQQEQGNERARGATALDDWADQRWLLTKDPQTQDRYLYVDGRMEFVPEFKLVYDRGTRHLTYEGGNRRTAVVDRFSTQIVNVLEVLGTTGALVGELEDRLGMTKKGGLSSALRQLIEGGVVIQRPAGNGKRNWLAEHAPAED